MFAMDTEERLLTTSETISEAALGGAWMEGLDRFFDLAHRHGVARVNLDCLNRSVKVEWAKPQTGVADLAGMDASNASHYESIYAKYCDMQATQASFRQWKETQLKDPTEAMIRLYLRQELEKLLKSQFLLVDDVDFTSEDLAVSEELAGWGLAEHGLEERYCLLRQMMEMEGGVMVVNEKATGRYLMTRCERLNNVTVKRFFRFVELCQLAREEIRLLSAETIAKLSDDDQRLLSRLLAYVRHGDWLHPATAEGIKLWLRTLFGDAPELLMAEDRTMTRRFRDFFKGGRGGRNSDRADVSMANILGYLMRHHLLAGSVSNVSKDFFGSANEQTNNINKGRDENASQGFIELQPFMDRYRKLILSGD